jgi:hypothetical protein
MAGKLMDECDAPRSILPGVLNNGDLESDNRCDASVAQVGVVHSHHLPARDALRLAQRYA